MFTPDPIPRPAGPPASSTPLRDYFAQPHPGLTEGYAVLPRSLAESMPLPWQQQMTHLLAEFHHAFGHLNWPIYRVQPSRYEKLADLDEDQLAEVGCIVEIDANGELVYRERNGRRITNAEEATVLVSCLDPIPATQTAPAYSQPHTPQYLSQPMPQHVPQPAPQQSAQQSPQHVPQPAPQQSAQQSPQQSSQHQQQRSQGHPQQHPQMPVQPPQTPHPGFGPNPGNNNPNGQHW
jgi:hypothetical protein